MQGCNYTINGNIAFWFESQKLGVNRLRYLLANRRQRLLRTENNNATACVALRDGGSGALELTKEIAQHVCHMQGAAGK